MTKEKTKKKKGLFSSLKNAITGKASKKEKDENEPAATTASAANAGEVMGAGQSSVVCESNHAKQIGDGAKSERMDKKEECSSSPAPQKGASSGPFSPELTLDLDAVGDENHLSNDAALHKLAVAPKQKHPPSSPGIRSRVLGGDPSSPSPFSADVKTPGTPDSDHEICTTLVDETAIGNETNAEITDGVSFDQNSACGTNFLLQSEDSAKPNSSNFSQVEAKNHVNQNNDLDFTSSFGTTSETSKLSPVNGHDSSSSNGNVAEVSDSQVHQNEEMVAKSVNETLEVSRKSPTASRIPEKRPSKIPKLPPSGNSSDSPSEKQSPAKNLPLSLASSTQSSSTFTREQSAALAKSSEPETSSSSTSSPSTCSKSSTSTSGIPKLVSRSGIPRPRESKEPEDAASVQTTAKTKSSESIDQQIRRESFEYKRKGSLKSQIPKLAAAATDIA